MKGLNKTQVKILNEINDSAMPEFNGLCVSANSSDITSEMGYQRTMLENNNNQFVRLLFNDESLILNSNEEKIYVAYSYDKKGEPSIKRFIFQNDFFRCLKRLR